MGSVRFTCTSVRCDFSPFIWNMLKSHSTASIVAHSLLMETDCNHIFLILLYHAIQCKQTHCFYDLHLECHYLNMDTSCRSQLQSVLKAWFCMCSRTNVNLAWWLFHNVAPVKPTAQIPYFLWLGPMRCKGQFASEHGPGNMQRARKIMSAPTKYKNLHPCFKCTVMPLIHNSTPMHLANTIC